MHRDTQIGHSVTLKMKKRSERHKHCARWL